MYAKSNYPSELVFASQQNSEAGFSESDIDSPMYTPSKAGQGKSSSSVKMCRNFMLGVHCPFEDRCAFSHGPVVNRRSSTTVPPPPPSYAATVNDAPPTYTEFIHSEPVVASRPPTPPYPAKFRYDPYNRDGVVYAY
mmetsp:Transcript_32427/g.37485  ORF Transcript_32427/g.37485 Transcript_32427/m.37485 type:complete len:137 (+) Transcript_32427:76-486(+)